MALQRLKKKNGIIRLTNETSRLLGHAFDQSSIKFKNATTGKALSFSTAFAFAIVPEYPKLGGHGLAFAISPTKELPGVLPSQYLGLLDSTDDRNFSNHIFDVEFDIVQDFEFNDNHVRIDINSLTSNASVPAAYFIDNSTTTKEVLNLKSGKTIQAWIDYDSTKNKLDVQLSQSSERPMSPMFSFDVDLPPILEDYVYVGFSASTGN